MMASPEKILIVDDNVETVRMIELVLKRAGYQVIAAHHGSKALLKAQSELPDLILLDVMMPGIDGYQVTRQLHTTPSTADIPIIIFTAKSNVDDQLLGFKAGADDYLDKTSSPLELVARVRAVLARSVKAQQRGKLIGVLAVKGGLGVSTMALNLGVAIHQQSQDKVIVTDFRPGYGSLALTLGQSRPEGINTLLQYPASEIDTDKVERELTRHTTGIHLLVASYQPRDARLANSVTGFRAIASALTQLARYTIVDLGPSLPPVNAEILKSCDEILILVDPIPQTLSQTKSLLDDLRLEGINTGLVQYVLFNRGGSSLQLSRGQVEEQLNTAVATTITPAAEMAYQAGQHKLPLIMLQPDGMIAEQFANLAKAIIQRLG